MHGPHRKIGLIFCERSISFLFVLLHLCTVQTILVVLIDYKIKSTTQYRGLCGTDTEGWKKKVSSKEKYVRSYSRLEGFQPAYTMEYSLLQGRDCPMVRVCRLGAAPRKVELSLNGCSEQRAQLMLRFLYENAVSLENVAGVVADCCGM